MNVTCDNAANNDTMIDHLGVLVPTFQGGFHRTRCFAHIVNLVVKSLIRQFDAKKGTQAEAELDEDVRALVEMAESLAEEDAATLQERREAEGDDAPFEDDEDDWVDEVESLSAEERAEFEQNVRPVKLVLAKVCGHVAFSQACI